MNFTSTLSAPADDAKLIRSRAFCERLTKAAAKNFYYGLKLLPEPKRSAMFVLYAYMRLVDDIADEDDGRTLEERERDLERWRVRTHEALAGTLGEDETHEVWPAFSDLTRKYSLPEKIFDAVIAGQCQDLRPKAFETFEQLHEYCYRVAGVVGLGSIHIWGFEGGDATQALAVERGVAFQLTNILRDLREDAGRGRVYLPMEDLARFSVSEADILAGRTVPGLEPLLRFEIERAEMYYEKSKALEERIERDSRATLMAMTEIYHGLLKKVAADPMRILRERVSLSVLSKLRIGWRATRACRR